MTENLAALWTLSRVHIPALIGWVKKYEEKQKKLTRADSNLTPSCQSVPNSIHSLLVKTVLWHPKARSEIKGFPDEVKRELGYLIFRLQNGESFGLPASRPMPDVAAGMSELRVRGADGVYRAFYFLKTEDQVAVFHAFKKKTQATPPKEIKLGAKRLRELLDG